MSADLDDLLQRAEDLPRGPQQVAAIEEVVRLADARSETKASFFGRISLVKSATWADQHEKAFVAFSWCIANFEGVAEDWIAEYKLLWYFKWVLGNIGYVSAVPTDKIVTLEDEMERWYTRLGYSTRPVEKLRLSNRRKFGWKDELEDRYLAWQARSRDMLADCVACEHDSELNYLLALGEDERAVRLGRDICEGRYGSCNSVPKGTWATLIRPLIRLDRIDEAREILEDGLPLVAKEVGYAGDVAEHVLLLTRLGEHTTALRHIEQAIPLAVDEPDRYDVACVAGALLESIHAIQPEPLSLSLPADHELYDASGSYRPEVLAGRFLDVAREIAGRFDARNGTSRWTDDIEKTRTLALP